MTFPGDQHQVSGFGHHDGQVNGLSAIDLHRELRHVAHAAHGLVDDVLRVLAARVVAGDHTVIGEFLGDRAHAGPLGDVAVAATAEHHDHALLRELLHGLQDVLQGVVGVGVIDEDGEILALVHRFEPPADRREIRNALGNRGRLDPQRRRHRRRRHTVIDVMLSRERTRQVHFSPRRGELEPTSRQARLEVRHPDVGRAPKTEPNHPGPCRPDHLLPVFVIRIDNGQGLVGKPLEQSALCAGIARHVLVEVEVLATEVGEDRGGEVDVVHAPGVERVTGDLQHREFTVGPGQLAQESLDDERLGRRVECRRLALARHVADGPDEPRPLSGRLEDRADEVGGGCFPVGPRDADDRESSGRMMKKQRGDFPKRRAAVSDHELWDADAFHGMLDHDRGRAGGRRSVREVVSVGFATHQRDEEFPAPHDATVELDA